MPANATLRGLVDFVEQVLDRLRDAGVQGTLLEKEWADLAGLDTEEKEFAEAAARLGLDPFDVDESLTSQILSTASRFDAQLFEEFLDSADANQLESALLWLDRAMANVTLGQTDSLRLDIDDDTPGQPWAKGYEAARTFRTAIGLEPHQRIDLNRYVGLLRLSGNSAGLAGVVGVRDNAVGLVIPEEGMGSTSGRFAQGRALAIATLTRRGEALLDPTRTDSAKMTRAFAAELIAPAEGIAQYMRVLPEANENAFDAIADRYQTSSLLIHRQFENQLA